MAAKQPLTLTVSALDKVTSMLTGKEGVKGIRIGTRTKGCNGLSYTLTFAYAEEPMDEVIRFEDFNIYIDPKAILFILGTEMDYKVTDLEEGFVFQNPNEKGRCGCGESFHV